MIVAGGGNAVHRRSQGGRGPGAREGARRRGALRAHRRHRRGERARPRSPPRSRRFGALHGLVNCAGIVHGEKIVGKEGPHSLAGFARTININLDRHVQHDPARRRGDGKGTPERRRRARRDRQHRVGRGVRRPDRTGGVQRVEGAASSAMTLPIARELARYGIRVMTIAPGHLRDADDGEPRAGRAGVARQDGAVSAAARASRRSSHRWCAEIIAQRDAERRSDSPRRRDPDGAEVADFRVAAAIERDAPRRSSR